MTTSNEASKLLDFSQAFDVPLLDKIVNFMYTETGETQKKAIEFLTEFKNNPHSWTRVYSILELSNNQQTKYYALQILENVITTSWNIFPRNQCEGIKNYIVGLVIKISSHPETLKREKLFISKLNIVLVQIVKREWPNNWPTFIPDIVGSSQTSESLCQNNMAILNILNDEVFDFSSGQMSQAKVKQMKDTMCSEFSQIFQLCQFVLNNSQNVSLNQITLETLLKFINWIPLGYIFQKDLISTLISKFLNVPSFRNVTLQCLTEIVNIVAPRYNEKYMLLFKQAVAQLKQIIPIKTDIKLAYKDADDSSQQFIKNMTMFLSTFLKKHGHLIERNMEFHDPFMTSMHYLVLISEIDETETFKICLEYWNQLAESLYKLLPAHSRSSGERKPLRKRLVYIPFLTKMRHIMIDHMAKPDQVLVVENEDGELVREFLRDTDSTNIYKSMRETLVYLTHLDCEETMNIMKEKLQNQVNGKEWCCDKLNKICWAIGSISGALSHQDEKFFLTKVLLDLFKLGKQNKVVEVPRIKAIVGANIMYVVGQYPDYLKSSSKFRKTVLKKLYLFMHVNEHGLQDMACDTFVKIAHRCRREFDQNDINEILNNITTTICDLNLEQIRTFYEAVGHMISAQKNHVKEELIEKYMSLPNLAWDSIIHQATENIEVLKDPELIKQLINILKTNTSVCKVLGHSFVVQLKSIYLDMMNVYKAMSSNIKIAVELNCDIITKESLIKSMKTVKKETLKLISCWISQSTDHRIVLNEFFPYLLDTVLLDYQTTVPSTKEPEVLSVMVSIVKRLKSNASSIIPKMFDYIFESTLYMITKNCEDFPEHRIQFYLLLKAVNDHCFSVYLNMRPDQFKLIIDLIFWGFKHTMREVANTALNTLYYMLINISRAKMSTQGFYQTYYTLILQHIFSVATDVLFVGHLSMFSTILSFMFGLIEDGKVTVSLNPADLNSPLGNKKYIQECVMNLLKTAFSHLSFAQIKISVEGMFNSYKDVSMLRGHLRDILVQLKEFTREDNSELFKEEHEAARLKADEEKRQKQMAVPGLLNPQEDTNEQMN